MHVAGGYSHGLKDMTNKMSAVIEKRNDLSRILPTRPIIWLYGRYPRGLSPLRAGEHHPKTPIRETPIRETIAAPHLFLLRPCISATTPALPVSLRIRDQRPSARFLRIRAHPPASLLANSGLFQSLQSDPAASRHPHGRA